MRTLSCEQNWLGVFTAPYGNLTAIVNRPHPEGESALQLYELGVAVRRGWSGRLCLCVS